jgi:RNA polymerase sigma-70 factor (ECF subfamily)
VSIVTGVRDAELVARAQRGDAVAFGELVERHSVAVYRAARAALGSHAEAEDAAQDALMKAHQRLADFRGECSFKTWLLVITWRHALNRRRRLLLWWRRAVPDQGNGQCDTEELKSDAWSPEEEVAARELRLAIRDEVRRLSPKLRDALLLAQTGEYTYDELGAMLNAPAGTIKWRVSEARRVVKARLRSRGYGDAG